MRKSIFLAVALTFVVALCAVLLSTPNTHAQERARYDIEEFSDFQTALRDSSMEIELTVVASFEMEETVTIPKGKTVTIASADAPQTVLRGDENESVLFEVPEETSLTISNLILDGNKANVPMAHSLVYNFGSLTLSDGAVLQNNNADFGGGVYNRGSCFISGDALITGNSVSGEYTGSGGGVMNYDFAVFEMTAGTISNNNASKFGGGIDSADSTGTVKISGTASITGNSAEMSGGGISNAATLIISGGTISNNRAADSGGGINHASLDDKQMEMTVSGGAVISYNRASKDGGGICNASLCELSEAVVTNNEAFANGGGIHNFSQDGDLRVAGKAAIAMNTAVNGGGVSNAYRAHCAIEEEADIHNNDATNGGGVYAALWYSYGDVAIEMDGGFVRGNTAQNGGGVYLEGETLLFTILNGEISDNTAEECGGGVYVDASVFVFSDGGISGNQASNGGGVYNAGAFDMESGTVVNNAAKNGGGIYNTGEAELTGGTVTGNEAKRFGSGICFEDGALNLSGAAQVGAALGDGNGIYFQTDKAIGIRALFSGFANIEGAEHALSGVPVVHGIDEYVAGGNDIDHFYYMSAECSLAYNETTGKIVLEASSILAWNPAPTPEPTKTGDGNSLLSSLSILVMTCVLGMVLLHQKKRSRKLF